MAFKPVHYIYTLPQWFYIDLTLGASFNMHIIILINRFSLSTLNITVSILPVAPRRARDDGSEFGIIRLVSFA